MSKVFLSVVGNENGKTIDIPIGKTVLGRGPLLGCADKKVSRNHAVLEVLVNGEIYLTPTHVNPCFYRTKSETSLRIIKKDAAQKIEAGDVFSLLPNSFQYEVCVTSNDSNAKKDSSKSENDEKSGNRLTENSKDSKSGDPVVLEKSHDNKIEEKQNNESINESAADKEETLVEPKEPTKSEQTKSLTKPLAEESNKIKKKAAVVVDEGSDVEEIPLDDDEDDFDDEEAEEEEEEWETSKNSKRSPGKSKEKASQRPRKRTLPLWLLKSASVPRLKQEANGPSRQTPAKKNTGEKGRAKNSSRGNSDGQRSVSRSSRQKQTIQRISLDDFLVSEEDWSSEEDVEDKRKGGKRSRREDDSGSDWEFDNRKGQTGRWKAEGSSDSDWEMAGSRTRGRRRSKRYRDDSESGSDWETETRKKKVTPVKKSPRKRRSKRSEKEEEEEEEEDEESVGDDSQSRPPSQGSSRKREPCLFGKKCYRKNTSHFEVYSHPGDSDYTSPDEDRENSDEKPECQYGIDCQRKNPKHRSEFSHTKKIRPKREASRKTGKKGKGDDENDPEDLSMDESDDYNPESDAS